MEDEYKPCVRAQRRLNPNMKEVVKAEVSKLLDAGIICPISDSSWVSPVQELNDATRKDHFPLPFIDQMLERLSGHMYYCFLDGLSGYFQIPIALEDQEKTTFTCPYGTFAYRRMPFGLCNAPATFQCCMMAIFDELVEDIMEVFVDDFSECLEAFNTLKDKLINAPIITEPDLNFPFELICDASDFAVGAVLGQRRDKHFQPIYYASKTLTPAQENYTTMEKELLAVDKKGAKNLAADHLSRLENSNQVIRRCVTRSEASKILEHCHSGLTGGHYNVTKTAHEILESCFYWPTLFQDANRYVASCDKCQRTGNISKHDEMPQTYMFSCEIFDIWGIDFMGPFLSSFGNKCILVDVDYMSKWVEAQALPTNDARVVVRFLKKLFSRFGTPRVIISDRGTHFCNAQFDKTLKKYGVHHKIATPYHPQTSGQVEVEHRELKRILEKIVESNRKDWTIKLNELDEWRTNAYGNSRLYKEATKRHHDARLRHCKSFRSPNCLSIWHSRGILSTRLCLRPWDPHGQEIRAWPLPC
ncbi:hypothetical protein CXB51_028284 [Gossypium anomalum]|uniref:Integrase catalytic domain-containing protein n=1 Tax=Gossypium anomalum TaxID=47600 RepID=A0A8J6CPH7_9ROSI|nr:hypothetical protein CXB51_028284 [Gossypium anomalum]